MRLLEQQPSSKGPAERFTGDMRVDPIPDQPMTHLALSDTVPHGDRPAVTSAEHVTEQEYNEAAPAAEKE